MKTILVPTDFSDVAENALQVAVQIARLNNSQIKLLTMTEFPALEFAVFDSAVFTKEDYNNEIKKDATRELARLSERYPDVSIKSIVKDEDVSLTASILSEKADLVVMGSTGAKGWKEFVSGSHAQYVVRYSDSPVLVVKENTKDFKLENVLFVTDFTNTEFIHKALKVVNTTQTRNHFLYVDNGMKFFNGHILEERVQQIAETFKIKDFDFKIQNADTIEKGILEYAEEISADIIIMYTHGREGLSRIFNGSIAEDVVNHSQIPVMTILE